MTRIVALIAAGLAAVAGVVAGALVIFSSPAEYQLTAQFVATPGLYPHNSVDVLGVPAGHIVRLTPRPGYVDVVIALPKRVHVPATAQAVLMAPNPVSDRFVELTPPYTGGPSLSPGAVIPPSRTVVPLELDQVYDSVDQLAKDLGPSGANSNGDLTAALHAFAQLADGNGADVHQAIASIAAALPALTAHPDDLSRLVTGLDTLTKTLASRNSTLDALFGDLATATSQLSAQRQTIATAATDLQQGVAQVAAFIKANQKAISGSVSQLSTTLDAVMREQQSLITTFDLAALGFQNFNRAIQGNADCLTATGAPKNCAALWGRLDLPSNIDTLLAQYCGSSIGTSFLPIMEKNAGLGDASARETSCGAQIGLLQNRPGPPGSPTVPDLDLSHYLGAK